MFELAFSIICSVLLLPINLFCSFWIFKEALRLSGATFSEFLKDLSGRGVPDSTYGSEFARNRAMRKRRKMILGYLLEESPAPERTKRLFYGYCLSTIPGFLALSLAGYTAYASYDTNALRISMLGNAALLGVNLALVIMGRVYRRRNPLDERTEELLKQKRGKEKEDGRKNKTKNIVVYTLVASFFLGFLLFFFLGPSGVLPLPGTKTGESQKNVLKIADFYEVQAVLSNRGFETANIPTTYWSLDESKLINVVSGKKGETAFEFYEYTDGKTTDLVYNEIIYDFSQEMDPRERESHEQELIGGGKRFTLTQNGTYILVLYKENTVVYARSPENETEIQDILIELGYMRKAE